MPASEFLAARDAIFDFYMRTPPGGKANRGVIALCPNHCTPARLLVLLDTLDELARATRDGLLADAGLAAAVAALQGPLFGSPSTALASAWNDLARLRDRLADYRLLANIIATDDPDLQACETSASSVELTRRVVEPLFFGHFPAGVEPFMSQPAPFNGGEGLSDLSWTFVLANQAGMTTASLRENFEQLKTDVKEATGETLAVVAEAGGAVAAVLVGLGVLALANAIRRR